MLDILVLCNMLWDHWGAKRTKPPAKPVAPIHNNRGICDDKLGGRLTVA